MFISVLAIRTGDYVDFSIFVVTPCMLSSYSIIIPTKLRGLSPHANYTDRAAAASRRN